MYGRVQALQIDDLAKVAELADAPDLGFQNIAFTTVLCVSLSR
jgi:hypothetical protein